jgi:hypothetical protein
MRTLCGLCLALVFTGGLFAQNRGGSQPFMSGAPANVLFPAGTPANNPFITRAPSNVVYPGGGGPHLVVPGNTQRVPRSSFSSTPYVYAYPIYVPSYDQSYGAPADSGAPAQSSSPNVIVIYPPQVAPVAPVETARPHMQVYQPDASQPVQDTPSSDRYLFAFKDHSIYSAVAYWVDGDTLHYFTNGNTHNQASLSLLDRDLTERLNRESGMVIKLPPKQ